jgi:hypothetical protein
MLNIVNGEPVGPPSPDNMSHTTQLAEFENLNHMILRAAVAVVCISDFGIQ